jgi:hypothetical protein
MKHLSGLFFVTFIADSRGRLSFYGITYGNEIMGEVAEMPPHFGVGVNLVFLGLICGAIRALLTWLQKRKST